MLAIHRGGPAGLLRNGSHQQILGGHKIRILVYPGRQVLQRAGYVHYFNASARGAQDLQEDSFSIGERLAVSLADMAHSIQEADSQARRENGVVVGPPTRPVARNNFIRVFLEFTINALGEKFTNGWQRYGSH